MDEASDQRIPCVRRRRGHPYARRARFSTAPGREHIDRTDEGTTRAVVDLRRVHVHELEDVRPLRRRTLACASALSPSCSPAVGNIFDRHRPTRRLRRADDAGGSVNDDGDLMMLRLAPQANGVVLVRQAIVGVGEALGVSPRLLADIKLAVSEACTNAILHGYADAAACAKGTLTVVARRVPGAVVITVHERRQGRRAADRQRRPGARAAADRGADDDDGYPRGRHRRHGGEYDVRLARRRSLTSVRAGRSRARAHRVAECRHDPRTARARGHTGAEVG